MSRRVVFQTINDPDDVQLEEKEEEAEEKADEHEAYLQMIREQARREQNLERRLKRRRKAHGSVFYRYATIRLQLRHLLSSTKNLLILAAGFVVVLGIWAFLVFGKPNSPSFWTDINSRWGGLLSDNTSVLCEAPQMEAFTRQRANGFATVCYALVAWFILFVWFLDERRSSTFEARFGNLPAALIIRRNAWSFIIGLSLLFLSVGSWLRHATYSNVGRQLETSGYWTVLFAYSSCSISRLVDPPRKLRTREYVTISKIISFVFIFTVAAVDIAFAIRLEAFGTQIPQIIFGVLTGLALLAVVIHWRLHRLTIETEIWLLLFGLFFFIVGFLLARFDLQLCISPTSFFQPYALWHVFAALTGLFLFIYLRSDLWAKGDGADLAPSIKPLVWMKIGVLGVSRYFRELFTPSESIISKEPNSSETALPASDKRPRKQYFPKPAVNTSRDDPESPEDVDENHGAENSRKNLNAIWTPERFCTPKQIRAAEVICGLLITGFVVYVIYLALSHPI